MGLPVTESELRDLLVKRLDVLDQTKFETARSIAKRSRIPFERALVELTGIPYTFLLEQIAHAWDVDFIDLKITDVRTDALLKVPEDFARQNGLIAFAVEARKLRVAMRDPRNRKLLEDIKRKTGLNIVACLSPEIAISRAQMLYDSDLREMLQKSRTEQVDDSLTRSDKKLEAPELLMRILRFAVATRSSDIHIEPYETEVLVRCRIDGVLQTVMSFPPEMLQSLVARIKVLSGMRTDERRAPQDGRFQADIGGFSIDLRVSSLPSYWGEKVVCRLLSKEGVILDLEKLGLTNSDYQIVVRHVLRPHGMVLITGPTGSGKSTTLYAMVMRVGAERQSYVSISTVEDPIEYTMPRVTQVQVNSTSIDFSTGLRALLRQDPDVIMVGEIRDHDTAEVAARAAMVGRLLLSTLHTNDATSTIPRLLNMGIEPFLLASTLSLVVGQRLVRRLCSACRESIEPDAKILASLAAREDVERTIKVLQSLGVLAKRKDPFSGLRLFRGKGCLQCNWTGFRGRLGIFELFEINDQIRSMIIERRDASTIRAAAIDQGMKTMFEDGLAKVLMGETTLEEVVRVAI